MLGLTFAIACDSMGTVITKDGNEIFYKDWGKGKPVVFSHAWPLNANVWDDQMMFVTSHGYRAIAHDRRGHGRSSHAGHGYDMDTFADDLAAVLDALDLHDVTLVGHSMGGGEVTRYLGRHGSKRVSRVVLVGAVPPLMVRTEDNPDGVPMETFDAFRAGLCADRSQFFHDLTSTFYGANRRAKDVSHGLRDQFWFQAIQVGLNAAYESVKAFSETDFTEDLKKIDVPTLFIHGDDDQIVPMTSSSQRATKLVQGSRLKVYPGADHGLTSTRKNEFNDDLLAFMQA